MGASDHCLIPFLQRWQGKPLRELARSPERFYGAQNTSSLDGFDVAYLQLLLGDILKLDLSNVGFLVLPDTSSMYVSLRANECDFAAAAVELDSTRALCPADCPIITTSATSLDYSSAEYRDRQRVDACCLTYSVPHLPASGFALLSIARRGDFPLVGAIVSVEVLNVATPIIIGIFVFGWLIFLLEHPTNGRQFSSQSAGIYFAFVSLATFGYGDLSPRTRGARLLVIFFTVFSTLSLATLTSVVSARLISENLAAFPLDTLSGLQPGDVCVEKAYSKAIRQAAALLDLAPDNMTAAGVLLSTPIGCLEAVKSRTVKVYFSDQPLLSWLAYSSLSFSGGSSSNLYVSPVLHANPLGFAFVTGSPLLGRINSAVIASLSDSEYSGSAAALRNEWSPTAMPQLEGLLPGVEWGTLYTALIMTGIFLISTMFQKLFTGDMQYRLLSRLSLVHWLGHRAADLMPGVFGQVSARIRRISSPRSSHGGEGMPGPARPTRHSTAVEKAREAAHAAAAAGAAAEHAARIAAQAAAAAVAAAEKVHELSPAESRKAAVQLVSSAVPAGAAAEELPESEV